jgi:nucleoside-diphosphate-sugar epimerase
MKTLITGADGFIGLELLNEISLAGISSKAIIREESHRTKLESFTKDILLGEIANFLDSKAIFSGIDGVVHLAGRAHKMNDQSGNPLVEYRNVNRDLTLNLAQASLKAGVKKFVFISSVKVVGDGRQKRGSRQWILGSIQQDKKKERLKTGNRRNKEMPKVFTENEECKPDDPYGISKWEAEQELTRLFSTQSDAQCIILRLPMVYGPGNKGNMLTFLKAASKGIPLPIKAARAKRSMIYVKNVCDAILKILQNEASCRPSVQTYFINDGQDITSGELYSIISQAYNGQKGVFLMPEGLFRLGGITGSWLEKIFDKKLLLNKELVSRLFDEYRFSSESFCRDYDWKPPHTLEQGIKDTVSWHKSLSYY